MVIVSGKEDRELSKYTPAFEPVSLSKPTEAEKRFDASLENYVNDEIKLESDEEMLRRDAVLSEVRNIFINWVKKVALEVLRMPEDEAEDAGGELFISGSHRLGVRDVGADIDTVCVAPNFCTREHFFRILRNDFEKRPEVTDLNAVENAFVPLMSFDFRGVSIDLLFARLAENIVPRNLDILDDNVLIGLDEATEKSLNGPRVTNMICKLLGESTFANFIVVLRCIRKWAKRRGIYGNKLGYLGGVNCNILVAFICQLFPNSGPSSLLFRFFKYYKDWKWPDPIMLNNIQQNPPGQLPTDNRVIWSAKNNSKDLMPIITPAYPAMNSAYNVSQHSFDVICSEFSRGYSIMEKIFKGKNPCNAAWEDLFAPSEFFLKYPHYLACHIVGTGENLESRSWIGFVESRIRRLTHYPYLETLPLLSPIHLHPVVSKTTKSANSVCYFIGFSPDRNTLKEASVGSIAIDECVARFQESLLDPEKGYNGEQVDGLDFFVEHLVWKKLPKEVFAVYGGYQIAKDMRKKFGFCTGDSYLKNNSRPSSNLIEINSENLANVRKDLFSDAEDIKNSHTLPTNIGQEVQSNMSADKIIEISLPTLQSLKRRALQNFADRLHAIKPRLRNKEKMTEKLPALDNSFFVPSLTWNLIDK